MIIKFDNEGYVDGFAEIGGMGGACEWTGAIPNGFRENCRVFRLENGVLVKDTAKEQQQQNRAAAEEELVELYEWFAWYDNQCSQYQRAVRMGEKFDWDMSVLDSIAKEKQARIREIREGV